MRLGDTDAPPSPGRSVRQPASSRIVGRRDRREQKVRTRIGGSRLGASFASARTSGIVSLADHSPDILTGVVRARLAWGSAYVGSRTIACSGGRWPARAAPVNATLVPPFEHRLGTASTGVCRVCAGFAVNVTCEALAIARAMSSGWRRRR
jgi:hypothetical protein